MSEDDQVRQLQVLICGSNERIADRVASVLPDARLQCVPGEPELLAMLASSPIDLVVVVSESSGSYAELLRQINLKPGSCTQPQSQPKTRVILIAVQSAQEDVLAVVRGGAFSYFSKPHFETAFDEILRHAASGADWEDSVQVESATKVWLRLIVRCEPPTADRVIQFINEVSDLGEEDREQMGFALKEILMNAMEYGGQFDRERLVEVSYVRGQHMVIYRVRDPGKGFSLDELTHSAIANPPEEPVRHLEIRDSMGIRPGGYGVLLAQKLVDDLIYNEQGNDVLLIKYLDSRDPKAPTNA